MQFFKIIIGWGLLAIGIVVIGWALYSSYNIFYAKAQVPEVFKFGESEISQTSGGKENVKNKEKTDTGLSEEEIKNEMEKLLNEQIEGQLNKIIPPNSIQRLLNLISWSIFSGILIFGGGKISGLGIRMIKVE